MTKHRTKRTILRGTWPKSAPTHSCRYFLVERYSTLARAPTAPLGRGAGGEKKTRKTTREK
eukprot:4333709-Pleurochrysis_carterae.AAC.1